jgi:hypothetical protein
MMTPEEKKRRRLERAAAKWAEWVRDKEKRKAQWAAWDFDVWLAMPDEERRLCAEEAILRGRWRELGDKRRALQKEAKRLRSEEDPLWERYETVSKQLKALEAKRLGGSDG